MMAAPIAGSLSIQEGDMNFSGIPDPFSTIVREAKEELGVSISTSDIKFFGLGRELPTLKPELIGEINISLKEKEFLQIQKDWTKDGWEIEREFIADHEEIVKLLSMKDCSPPAWASTYLSVMGINADH